MNGVARWVAPATAGEWELVLDCLPPDQRELIVLAADVLVSEIWRRSHGNARLGRVGAYELLYRLGIFVSKRKVVR